MFLKTYLVVLIISLFLGIVVKIISIANDDDLIWEQRERVISLAIKTTLFIWGIVELVVLFK